MGEDDELWMIVAGIGFVAFGGLYWLRDEVVGFLLEHHIVVAGDRADVVIPGVGAGLDTPRIFAAAAMLLALLLLVRLLWRRRRTEAAK